MKIAFYKGEGDWTDKLIRFWTVGDYSHVEIVIGDLWYTSSWYDGGVVARKIDYDSSSWDFIEVPDCYIQSTLELYNKTKGSKYDLVGILLNEIIPINKQSNSKWYCSEWVAEALMVNIKTNPNKLFRILSTKYK